MDGWLAGDDLWLIRAALLHMNRWKARRDADWLFAACLARADHPDFFVRKAIGWALRELLPRKRAINPPLGLATVAALTPSHWRITILDENVEPLPTALDADVVGICGMAVQHQRQRELLTHYRQRGRYVVAGGAYASLSPEAYTGLVDTWVVGEAERTWPRFCQDFAAGRPRAQYRQHEPVDLRESPTELASEHGQLLARRKYPPPLVVIGDEAKFAGSILVPKIIKAVGDALNAKPKEAL